MAVHGAGALAEGLDVCLQLGNLLLQAFDVSEAALRVGIEVCSVVVHFVTQIFDVVLELPLRFRDHLLELIELLLHRVGLVRVFRSIIGKRGRRSQQCCKQRMQTNQLPGACHGSVSSMRVRIQESCGAAVSVSASGAKAAATSVVNY